MVNDDNYYERMQESWPEERPSRKRAKRRHRQTHGRRVVVRAERKPEVDAARVSRALLSAQRELAKAQAERDASQLEAES